jgi:hypothetical protein
MIIQNALTERIEVDLGDTKKSIARYTINEILDPSFNLPREGGGQIMDLPMNAAGVFYDEVR